MDTIDQIKLIIGKIRPYLNSEGGDLEFLGYKDGMVYVRMLGACADCGMLDMTLTDGIESMLKEEVPAVIGVKNILDPDDPILKDLEK
ncbi:MAG: NifU family protein [Anaeroplasmataceae bacterium]